MSATLTREQREDEQRRAEYKQWKAKRAAALVKAQSMARAAVDAYFASLMLELSNQDFYDLSNTKAEITNFFKTELWHRGLRPLEDARTVFEPEAACIVGIEVGRRLGGAR